MKFKLRKGKGSVNRFVAADGHVYRPGDIVELPASYLGSRWLELLEPKKIQEPLREVKVAPAPEAEEPAVPLEKPKKQRKK